MTMRIKVNNIGSSDKAFSWHFCYRKVCDIELYQYFIVDSFSLPLSLSKRCSYVQFNFKGYVLMAIKPRLT